MLRIRGAPPIAAKEEGSATANRIAHHAERTVQRWAQLLRDPPRGRGKVLERTGERIRHDVRSAVQTRVRLGSQALRVPLVPRIHWRARRRMWLARRWRAARARCPA